MNCKKQRSENSDSDFWESGKKALDLRIQSAVERSKLDLNALPDSENAPEYRLLLEQICAEANYLATTNMSPSLLFMALLKRNLHSLICVASVAFFNAAAENIRQDFFSSNADKSPVLKLSRRVLWAYPCGEMNEEALGIIEERMLRKLLEFKSREIFLELDGLVTQEDVFISWKKRILVELREQRVKIRVKGEPEFKKFNFF